MRSRFHVPAGSPAVLAGLLVALAGSFSDNVLGGGLFVDLLQLLLWTSGGMLVLAGVAASFTLGAGQRVERRRSRAERRAELRPAR